jgi:hypothetical protein
MKLLILSDPVVCIGWLREHADHLVRGNHDNALAFDLDCCMGSFREYSLATRAWKPWDGLVRRVPATCCPTWRTTGRSCCVEKRSRP